MKSFSIKEIILNIRNFFIGFKRSDIKGSILSESGRSMVEMLGVLAIVGVLTLTGLWGYKQALTMYRANELMEAMNRQVVLATAARAIGVDLEASEWNLEVAGFEVQYTPYYEEDGIIYNNYFTVMIKNIPSELLKALIDRDNGRAYNILIDGIPIDEFDFETYTRKIEPLNTIIFKPAFAADNDGHDALFVYTTEDVVRLYSEDHVTAIHPEPTEFCKSNEGWFECDNGRTFHRCRNGYWETVICEPNFICNAIGNCHCSKTGCSGGRILNKELCKCECPQDKPFWTGTECKKKECETPEDCLSWFSDADVKCMKCENNSCSVRDSYCENEWARECKPDGSLPNVQYGTHCNPEKNQKCEDGYCICDPDKPKECEEGEEKCSSDGLYLYKCKVPNPGECPKWVAFGCCKCADGTCKPALPNCCKEEKQTKMVKRCNKCCEIETVEVSYCSGKDNEPQDEACPMDCVPETQTKTVKRCNNCCKTDNVEVSYCSGKDNEPQDEVCPMDCIPEVQAKTVKRCNNCCETEDVDVNYCPGTDDEPQDETCTADCQPAPSCSSCESYEKKCNDGSCKKCCPEDKPANAGPCVACRFHYGEGYVWSDYEKYASSESHFHYCQGGPNAGQCYVQCQCGTAPFNTNCINLSCDYDTGIYNFSFKDGYLDCGNGVCAYSYYSDSFRNGPVAYGCCSEGATRIVGPTKSRARACSNEVCVHNNQMASWTTVGDSWTCGDDD